MSYHLDTKCSMVLVSTLRSYLYSYCCVKYHARWSSNHQVKKFVGVGDITIKSANHHVSGTDNTYNTIT